MEVFKLLRFCLLDDNERREPCTEPVLTVSPDSENTFRAFRVLYCVSVVGEFGISQVNRINCETTARLNCANFYVRILENAHFFVYTYIHYEINKVENRSKRFRALLMKRIIGRTSG